MARHDVGGTKKRAQDGLWTLIFIDEAGFAPTPVVKATWAPRGQRPILLHKQGKWDKVSAISGVTSRRRLYFRLKVDDSINAQDVREFARLLLRHIRGRIVLVWDNAKQHHAKIVTAMAERFRRLRIEFLPGYSPDFNPDEGVWDQAKVVELANYAPKDTKELVATARRVLRNIKRRPNKIAQFWKQSHLPLRGLETCLNLPAGG